MTDEKERVDWAALMDAHGIEPDANTASPAVEPSRRVESGEEEHAEAGEAEPKEASAAEQREARRRRMVHVIVAVCALFTIAACAAVLVAILRGDGDRNERADRSGSDDQPLAPVGPRPAAFEQTSDGVTVVPPVSGSQQPAAETPPHLAETTRLAAETPPRVAETPRPGAETPPSVAEAPPDGARKSPRAAEVPPGAAKKPRPGAKKPPTDAEAAPPAAKAPPAGETEAEPADSSLPEQPDMEGVAAAMAKLESDINACAAPARVSGEVGIKMRIEPDGSVPWASAKVQNSQFQACLDRLFKKARMPRSQKGATVRQTLDVP